MAWTNIAATGVLSYNGFAFDPLYKSKVSGRMVQDEAERTVIYTEYTFDITATVTSNASGGGTSADLLSMRQKLEAQGGEFHYDNKGFGTTFTVNAPGGGGVRDVKFGPKPQILEFTPIGDANAALVHWVCVVCIPDHCASPVYAGQIMARNYDIDYDIDADGMTTVRITGYLEIPMTRSSVDSRTLADVADRYYERIVPRLPAGFRPTKRSRNVSKDKRRLDFSFEFEELPNNGLPVNCTSASGTHSVRSMGNNMFMWVNRLSATYVVAKDKPKSLAWSAFQALLLDRLAKSNQSKGFENSTVFLSASFEDGLYQEGRKTSISFEYTFSSTLPNVMEASGIWTPVPGTNNTQWKTSVASALSPRGFAGLRLGISDDAIIDLCGGTTPGPTGDPPPPPPPRDPDKRTLVACPSPNTSWLETQNELEIEMEPQIARHQPLGPTLTAMPNLGGNPINFPVNANGGGSAPSGSIPYKPPSGSPGNIITVETVPGASGKAFGVMQTIQSNADIFQLRATPTFRIALVGFALRVCWPIVPPSLPSFGGWLTIPGRQIVKRRVVGRAGTAPINYCGWRLEYTTAGIPAGPVGNPPNPTLRTVS